MFNTDERAVDAHRSVALAQLPAGLWVFLDFLDEMFNIDHTDEHRPTVKRVVQDVLVPCRIMGVSQHSCSFPSMEKVLTNSETGG